MSIVAQKNNKMSFYELFQQERYGNVLPGEKEPIEEYEYLNLENREVSEWIEQQAEQQFEQQTTK